MGGYILRRCLAGLVTLLVASFLVFLLVAISGNPLANLYANPHISPATIQAARIQLHLNEPLLERYWTWLTGMLRGNFGTSTTGQDIGAQLGARLLVTLRMVIPATILALIIAVLIGVVSAVKQYSILDHSMTGLAYLFYSTPVFVVAILLKDFFAVDVNNAAGHTLIYTIGQNTPGTTGAWNVFADSFAHTVLPVITLALVTYAGWSRYQRASMLDVLNADYVRLARAKGLFPRRVLYVHTLRNALIPITTVVALDFATHRRSADHRDRVRLGGHGPLLARRPDRPGKPGRVRGAGVAAGRGHRRDRLQHHRKPRLRTTGPEDPLCLTRSNPTRSTIRSCRRGRRTSAR